MQLVSAFSGYHARPEAVKRVACPPYDVLTEDEARRIARDNPDSFIRVVRPEVDFAPGTDAHSEKVYRKAAENLRSLLGSGLLVPMRKEGLFILRLSKGDHEQTGLVAAADLEAYADGRIKKHELTRPEKETDRTRHMEAVSANTGLVFLAHRADPGVKEAVRGLCQAPPLAGFTADDGTGIALWLVDDPAALADLSDAFENVPHLYIADGHHRIASAARLFENRKGTRPGDPAARVLAAVFPHDELRIFPYNRLVLDLGEKTPEEVLDGVRRKFRATPTDDPDPGRAGVFGMFLEGKWYRLEPASAPPAAPPEKRLDVAILHDRLIRPILGIEDPRTDPRIEFIGGIDAAKALEARCRQGDAAAAFTCYPVSTKDVLSVADRQGIMPPKSTWFEPKLPSGLVVRPLDSKVPLDKT